MANTYATFTPGTSTNNNKFTMSVWCKRTELTGDYQAIYVSQISGGANSGLGLFWGNDNSVWYNFGTSSSALANTSTNAKFRDLNGWYHIVVAGDTTQSGTDKLKIWVNNVLQTSFGNDNRSSFVGLSYDLGNSTYANQLGRKHDGTYYFEGVLSHFHFVDGTTYTPSTFGLTDSTTGEWTINPAPTVTYGTNGFFLFKDNNSLTDQSTNSNNFTLGGGTLSKTEDCPSNVFCTINNNTFPSAQVNLGYGSTAKTNTPTTNQWRTFYGTIGASSGKYYFEMKVNNIENTDPNNFWVGIVDADQMYDGTGHHRAFQQSRGYCYHAQTGSQGNNNSSSSYGNSWTTNDIIGVAMDLDNSKLYFSKNGTWQNSGVPTSGSTGTGAISIASGYTYLPTFSQYYGNEWFSLNFGNGSFQGTTVASAGTNASGNGIFEYDCPTGYTALSTKGLNL